MSRPSCRGLLSLLAAWSVLITAPVAAAAAGGTAPAREAQVEGITAYRLANGLQVLLFPDSSKPTTTVALTVFVGSRHENYGERGMAHLFEHMLFKRTKSFPSIKEELTRLGGMANGTTSYDRTNYFEIFPADEGKLRRVLELEAERLRQAVISRAELATEMGVVRNELDAGENDPENVLAERLLSAAYLWHNYGNSPIGPASDIENVPNQKLLAWYETYYQPDNAMLVVAGKLDADKTLRMISATFGQIPRPRRVLPPTYTVEPTQDGERSVTVRRTGGTPILMLGYHVPVGTDPDYAAIDIIDRVLGEAPAGRLHKALVESGKAAKVDCQNEQLRDPGYLVCKAELRASDQVAPAREAMIGVVEGLARQPITAAEVERARASLLKHIALVLNSSEVVGVLLSEFAAMGDWRMLFVHRDRIEKIGVADVNRVAQRYLKPSNRVLGEYVPTAQPDRAAIAAAPDLAPVLRDYRGKAALAEGEAFDASPANIDARTIRTTLPGGMKLALLPKKTRGETVHAAISLRLGSESSLRNRALAAEVTAKMLLRGTRSQTRQQVREEIDRLQARVRVLPAAQSVTISIEVRRPNLSAVLDLVAECLRQPALSAKELEELRRELQSEYQQNRDDPTRVGMRGMLRLWHRFPKGHPLYVSSFEELIEDLRDIRLEDVRELHSRFYGTQDALGAVVGDFDPRAVNKQMVVLLGDFRAPERYVRVADPFSPGRPQDLTLTIADKPMAFLGMGLDFALRDDHPDYAAMRLADNLLGGGFLSSRVPQRLRERDGFSYGAGTVLHVSGHDANAALFGYAIYGAANLAKVEQGMREELTRAVDAGFTAEELRLGREGLLREREQLRADDEELVDVLREQLDLGRTMAFEQQLDERLRRLTAAEVGAALRKYVDPRKLSVLRVGDFKQRPKAAGR